MSDIMKFLDNLFNRTEKPVPVKYTIPITAIPTNEDVAASRDYKNRYGNSNEVNVDGTRVIDSGDGNIKYTQEGTLISNAPAQNAVRMYKDKSIWGPTKSPASQELADAVYKSQMMANTSPVSALGFDLDKNTFIKDDGTPLNYGGMYNETRDRIWSNLKSSGNPVHESTHRGLRMLRDKGYNIPDGQVIDEDTVRAILLNRFGDIESNLGPVSAAEVKRAQERMKIKEFNDLLTRADDAANKELGQRTWDRHGGVN